MLQVPLSVDAGPGCKTMHGYGAGKDAPVSASSMAAELEPRDWMAAASVIVARYGSTAGATLSEVKLLLSYTPQKDVEDFFFFIESILQRFGVASDLSLEEARSFARTPKNVQDRGQTIEEYLEFVTSTVARYATGAGATAKEVKAISRYMQMDEIVAYYDLVEGLCTKYRRKFTEVKLMLSTMGRQATESELASGRHTFSEENWHWGLGAPEVSFSDRQKALRALGFNEGADPQPAAIARQYRQLAKTWHPDKAAAQGPQAMEEATARFRDIKAAADVLLTKH